MRLWFTPVMLVAAVGAAIWGYERVPGVQDNGALAPSFVTSAFLEGLSFLVTAAIIGPVVAEIVERRHNAKWAPARNTARERLNAALVDVVEDYRTFIVTTITPLSSEPRIAPSHEMAVLIQRLDRFLDIYDEEHPVFDPDMHSAGSPVRRTLAELRNTMQVTVSIADPERSARVTIDSISLDKLRAVFGKAASDPAGAPADATGLWFDARVYPFGTNHVLPVFKPVDLTEMHTLWQRFLAGSPRAKRPPDPFNERTLQPVETQEAAYRAWLALFAEGNAVVRHMIKPIGAGEEPATGLN